MIDRVCFGLAQLPVNSYSNRLMSTLRFLIQLFSQVDTINGL